MGCCPHGEFRDGSSGVGSALAKLHGHRLPCQCLTDPQVCPALIRS